MGRFIWLWGDGMKKEIGLYDAYLNDDGRLEITYHYSINLVKYPAPFWPGCKFDYGGKTYIIGEGHLVERYNPHGDYLKYYESWEVNTADGLPTHDRLLLYIYYEVSPFYVGPKQAKSVIVKQGGVLREPKEIWVKKDGELKQVW